MTMCSRAPAPCHCLRAPPPTQLVRQPAGPLQRVHHQLELVGVGLGVLKPARAACSTG